MNSRLVNDILKLAIAIILLPVVIGISFGFYSQLGMVEKAIRLNFFFGIFIFLLFYLFLYEPSDIHKKGQRLVQVIFRFFSPLVKVASFCLPIYTILFLLLFVFFSLILKTNNYNYFFAFLIGFSFIFHLVFTAKTLRSKDSFFMFANYMFFMELIYLFNVFLVAFGFHYLLNGFSFVEFYHQTFAVAKDIYVTVIDQLFFIKSS